MGTWEVGIFDDDFASDIQIDFENYIEDGLSISEATDKILEEYEDIIEEENDDDDAYIVHLALAEIQIKYGKLEKRIKNKALEIIEKNRGLDRWEEAGEDILLERKKVLNKLKLKLEKS